MKKFSLFYQSLVYFIIFGLFVLFSLYLSSNYKENANGRIVIIITLLLFFQYYVVIPYLYKKSII